MYSTKAIAKKVQNGKFEIVTIQRGWTSEEDVDIDIKVVFSQIHFFSIDTTKCKHTLTFTDFVLYSCFVNQKTTQYCLN